MKQLFTLFLFICSLTAQAQDVNGTWVGNFVQYIHNRYDVELVVEKLAPGNIFSARLRVMDDYYFGEYNVSGFICNKKYLEITELIFSTPFKRKRSKNADTITWNDARTRITFSTTRKVFIVR